MKCWHKSLIPYLPRQELLGQWRECCCIAKSIAEKGTPNHILVNRIMDYPIEHFFLYGHKIYVEMHNRGYKVDFHTFERFGKWFGYLSHKYDTSTEIFKDWHNTRYLNQCMFNLEEKYDCQGITDEEWNVLLTGYKNITGKDWEN